jgi:hypothetical protein
MPIIPHREMQLSTLALSSAELSGAIESTFFDRRRHQLPHDWPSPIERFLHRPPSPQAKPPAHHPLPLRPSPPQAA